MHSHPIARKVGAKMETTALSPKAKGLMLHTGKIACVVGTKPTKNTSVSKCSM